MCKPSCPMDGVSLNGNRIFQDCLNFLLKLSFKSNVFPYMFIIVCSCIVSIAYNLYMFDRYFAIISLFSNHEFIFRFCLPIDNIDIKYDIRRVVQNKTVWSVSNWAFFKNSNLCDLSYNPETFCSSDIFRTVVSSTKLMKYIRLQSKRTTRNAYCIYTLWAFARIFPFSCTS